MADADSLLVLDEPFPHLDADRLYAYWTRPELLTTFWAQEASVDLRVGGEYRLGWPSLGRTLRGTYLDVVPSRRLEFTWAWEEDPEARDRTVSMAFAAVEGGSALTIRHGPYGEEAAEQEERAAHREGWLHFCAELRRRAAGTGA